MLGLFKTHQFVREVKEVCKTYNLSSHGTARAVKAAKAVVKKGLHEGVSPDYVVYQATGFASPELKQATYESLKREAARNDAIWAGYR